MAVPAKLSARHFTDDHRVDCWNLKQASDIDGRRLNGLAMSGFAGRFGIIPRIGIPEPVQILHSQTAFDIDCRSVIQFQQHITGLDVIASFHLNSRNHSRERCDDPSAIQIQLRLLLLEFRQQSLSHQPFPLYRNQGALIQQQCQSVASLQQCPFD